jgi:hypothetical protein
VYRLVSPSSNRDDYSKALRNTNTTIDTTKSVFPQNVHFSTYQSSTESNMEISSKHHQRVYSRRCDYRRGQLKHRQGVILQLFSNFVPYFTFTFHFFLFLNLAYLISLTFGHESLINDSFYLSLTHVHRFDSPWTIIRYDSYVTLTHTYSI